MKLNQRQAEIAELKAAKDFYMSRELFGLAATCDRHIEDLKPGRKWPSDREVISEPAIIDDSMKLTATIGQPELAF